MITEKMSSQLEEDLTFSVLPSQYSKMEFTSHSAATATVYPFTLLQFKRAVAINKIIR